MITRNNKIFNRFVVIGTVLILLDRPIQYLIEYITGYLLPTNALLLPVALILLANNDFKIPIRLIHLNIFLLAYAMLLIGNIWYDLYVISASTILFPFIIGIFAWYYFSVNPIKIELFYKIAFITTLLTLLIVFEFLPVITDQKHFIDGMLHIRSETYTDQNFQIFYLFWLVPLVFFNSGYRLLILYFLIFAGIYILSIGVASRTGLIIFLVAIFLVFITMNYKKTLIQAIYFLALFSISFLIFQDLIISVFESSYFFARLLSGELATGYLRLYAILFMLEKVVDLSYMLPGGYAEFIEIYGAKPHSNISAFFFEGGIIGLFCYIALILIPAVKLLWHSITSERPLMYKFFAINVFICFFIQSTLNVSLNEQVWFWAGIGIAMLNHKQFKVANNSNL